MHMRQKHHDLRRRLASASLAVLSGALATTAAEPARDSRFSKRVVSPVYGPASGGPIAVLRVATTQTEYQRCKFLCIGALPLLVAEQVRIEVRDASATAEVFAGLPEWLRAPGKGRVVELREFQLLGAGEPGPAWLTAARVRMAPHGQWEMRDGTVRQPDGSAQSFAHARLQITGEQTGRLMLPDGRVLAVLPPRSVSGEPVVGLLPPVSAADNPPPSNSNPIPFPTQTSNQQTN
jgi:hypothetical protein